jgi:hypothetical protein
MTNSDTTTERDVAHDVLAALDMFSGAVGSEETVIDQLDLVSGSRNGVVITLSNGDRYELTVRPAS